MCGLVGFSGHKPYDPIKIKILMLYNETRGKHSYGFYNNAQKEMFKDTGLISLNIHSIEIKPSNLFIGHTRQATIGAHTKENTHPYKYGKVVGAHNGQVKNVTELKDLFDLSETLNVDSQYIFKIMSKTNDLTVLKYVDAAAALLFKTDDFEDTLNVIRNNERPLFRGKCDEGIYLSSIKDSLEFINCEDIKEVKEDTLYQITNGEIKTKKLKLGEKVVKHVVQNLNVINGNNYGHNYGHNNYNPNNRSFVQNSNVNVVTNPYVVSELKFLSYSTDYNASLVYIRVSKNCYANVTENNEKNLYSVSGITFNEHTNSFCIKTNLYSKSYTSVKNSNVNTPNELVKNFLEEIYLGDYLICVNTIESAPNMIIRKGTLVKIEDITSICTFKGVVAVPNDHLDYGSNKLILDNLNTCDFQPLDSSLLEDYLNYGFATTNANEFYSPILLELVDFDSYNNYLLYYNGGSNLEDTFVISTDDVIISLTEKMYNYLFQNNNYDIEDLIDYDDEIIISAYNNLISKHIGYKKLVKDKIDSIFDKNSVSIIESKLKMINEKLLDESSTFKAEIVSLNLLKHLLSGYITADKVKTFELLFNNELNYARQN